MTRYSLFVLKVPLNTSQPTNQPSARHTLVSYLDECTFIVKLSAVWYGMMLVFFERYCRYKIPGGGPPQRGR